MHTHASSEKPRVRMRGERGGAERNGTGRNGMGRDGTERGTVAAKFCPPRVFVKVTWRKGCAKVRKKERKKKKNKERKEREKKKEEKMGAC